MPLRSDADFTRSGTRFGGFGWAVGCDVQAHRVAVDDAVACRELRAALYRRRADTTVPLVLGSRENIVVGVMLWRLFEDGHAAEAAAVATMLVACMTPLGLFARRAAA